MRLNLKIIPCSRHKKKEESACKAINNSSLSLKQTSYVTFCIRNPLRAFNKFFSSHKLIFFLAPSSSTFHMFSFKVVLSCLLSCSINTLLLLWCMPCNAIASQALFHGKKRLQASNNKQASKQLKMVSLSLIGSTCEYYVRVFLSFFLVVYIFIY